MDKSAKFWDRIAKRYAKQPVADEAAYQHKLALTQKYLRPDMKVLEFGCGTGSTAIVHSEHVSHIHAIDVSAAMIEIARQKATDQGVENIAFEVADIATLDVQESTKDVVLGLNILHLVENKQDVIEKVFQILKPGGVFVSSTICIGNSFKLKLARHFVSLGAMFGILPSLYSFSQSELKNSMISAGFKIDNEWQAKKSQSIFIVAKKD